MKRTTDSDLMRVLKPGTGIPNRWRYVQPETQAVFTGVSYYQVADAVFKHRQAMGLDISEGWERRLQHELCSQNLQAPCYPRESDKKPESISLSDVKRFISSMLGWNGTFVEQLEADRRAAICSTCPLQTEVPSCWGCAGAFKLLKQLIGTRHTKHEESIAGACALCKCAIKSKVWFPLEAINMDGLEPPEHCWMNR